MALSPQDAALRLLQLQQMQAAQRAIAQHMQQMQVPMVQQAPAANLPPPPPTEVRRPPNAWRGEGRARSSQRRDPGVGTRPDLSHTRTSLRSNGSGKSESSSNRITESCRRRSVRLLRPSAAQLLDTPIRAARVASCASVS
jgi:hypothetical protein